MRVIYISSAFHHQVLSRQSRGFRTLTKLDETAATRPQASIAKWTETWAVEQPTTEFSTPRAPPVSPVCNIRAQAFAAASLCHMSGAGAIVVAEPMAGEPTRAVSTCQSVAPCPRVKVSRRVHVSQCALCAGELTRAVSTCHSVAPCPRVTVCPGRRRAHARRELLQASRAYHRALLVAQGNNNDNDNDNDDDNTHAADKKEPLYRALLVAQGNNNDNDNDNDDDNTHADDMKEPLYRALLVAQGNNKNNDNDDDDNTHADGKKEPLYRALLVAQGNHNNDNDNDDDNTHVAHLPSSRQPS